MIPLKFVYLVGLVPIGIAWLVLYFQRSDLRKEMLWMSSLMAFGSFVTSYYFWTKDWWRPLTITGTRVGIEDILLGFAIGGIEAVIYEVVFKKKYYKRKLHPHNFLLPLLLLIQLITFLFWGVGLTSFWSCVLSLILVSTGVFIIRRDLLMNGILSGILTMLIAMLDYYFIMLISPQWIDHTYLSSLSGVRITGIPIEELIFWFLAGLLFGPLYEYWQGKRLVGIKKSSSNFIH